MPSGVRKAAVVLSPVLMIVFLLAGLLMALRRGSGFDAVALIVMACTFAGLGASAHYSRRFVLPSTPAFTVQLVALGLVAAAWLWQTLAFRALIPHHYLEIGYFLTAPGRRPRLLVMQAPFYATTTIVLILWLVDLIVAYRAGARWSLVARSVWFLALLLVFSLPSLGWVLQGDAAIFI